MVATIFIIILSLLVLLIVLGILMFVHEFGHFLFAKLLGVKVEEFGFGFPPRVWGKKVGETIYSINAILFAGAFVKLYGEDRDIKNPRSFSSLSSPKKSIIILGGVLMNLALAVILYTLILAFASFKAEFFMPFGEKNFPFGSQKNYVVIADIAKDSPAEKGGLQVGDKVLNIGGLDVSSNDDFKKVIDKSLGQEITLSVVNIKEGSKPREVQAIPRVNPPPDQGSLGVGLAGGGIAEISYPSPVEKIFSGFLHSGNVLQYTYSVLASLVQMSFEEGNVGPVVSNLSTPIGVFGIIGLLIREGELDQILSLIPMISLALFVFNLLPIPVADGGRLAFVVYEMVTGRKVGARFEQRSIQVGIVILILLFLVIAYSDILKLPVFFGFSSP